MKNHSAEIRSSLRPRTTYLLYMAAHSIRAELELALRPYGLTGMQYSILGMLAATPGLSSASVSRRFFVTPQTMNQIILTLVREELVSQEPDENNARVRLLFLTDKGNELMGIADAQVDEIETTAFACFDDAELASLRTLTARILKTRSAGK